MLLKLGASGWLSTSCPIESFQCRCKTGHSSRGCQLNWQGDCQRYSGHSSCKTWCRVCRAASTATVLPNLSCHSWDIQYLTQSSKSMGWVDADTTSQPEQNLLASQKKLAKQECCCHRPQWKLQAELYIWVSRIYWRTQIGAGSPCSP